MENHFEQITYSTFDALSAHIAVLDKEGTILAVNKAWREFAETNSPIGCDIKVNEGANYFSVCEVADDLSSKEARAMLAGIRSVINGDQKEFTLEYPCHSPTENRWFNARVTVFLVGELLRIIIAHENITKRKQAELQLQTQKEEILSQKEEIEAQNEELTQMYKELLETKVKIEESEEKYRLLFDTMTEGVSLNEMIFNEVGEGIDYRILEVNKAFYSTVDYSDSQVIGNVATKLYGMTNDLIKSFWENHKKVTTTQYTKMVSPLNSKCFLISTSPFTNNKFVTVFFDITKSEKAFSDLKIIEQELRKERDFTLRIMETSFVGIVYVDKNGKIGLANPRAVSIFGLTTNEVKAREYNVPDWHISDFDGNSFPEENLPFVKVKTTLKPVVDVQHAIEWPSGKRVLLSINAAPMIDANGEFEGMVASIEDITERKHIERSLIESEKNLRMEHQRFVTAMNSIDAGIYVSDLDTYEVLFANQYFSNLFGDIVGKKCYATIQKGQDSPCSFCTNHLLLDKNGNPNQPYIWEFQNTKTQLWFQLSDQAIKWTDGKLVRLEIAVDITERKKVEFEREQFFKFFRTSADIMVIADPLGAFQKINPTCTEILGYSEEELISKPFIDFIFPEDKQETIDEMSRQMQRGFSLNFENRYLCKDGSVKWLSWRAIFAKEEGITYATARDITEKKEIEEKIQKQNKELAELNASKDKFFSIIAHDLRGPFTGFLGLTELMQNPNISLEEVKNFSKMMNKSADNLSKLLENLLTWARMQKGAIEYNPIKIGLYNLANQSLIDLDGYAKQKDIELINSIPKLLKVFVDLSMINTVFRNLISNAIKFTNRGGKVIISAEKKDSEILVSVQDSGIGMNEKILSGIFRIDQKTSRPGTEKESSTGIGLLLCKEFIEKHNGKIWAESEENKGSTFYFTLNEGEISKSKFT